MTNKPGTSKRTFTPISISDSLRNVNKKFLYKFGKLDYTIHAKWSEIVGSFFVHHSEPQKISSIANSTNEEGETLYDRFLHVNVSPAAAVEFQHFQDKIIVCAITGTGLKDPELAAKQTTTVFEETIPALESVLAILETPVPVNRP